ncbi:hypothetical protein COV15_03400 [Candidatus Woesearchaeota archaeon CG10_big_fil_rev_8_21_14_0_10_34_12]|nr:MAG: hypothetical protein COV15_03400 [Candidatus Woesearchaeota archaeon CG10_big_fil_rev_8_21_14_0_10_34_12]
MGKRGELNKIKKFLNKEGKDKRGMKNLEETLGGRKTNRRKPKSILNWIAIGLIGLASCLPGYKAVKPTEKSGIERVEEPVYKLSKENGKDHFEGYARYPRIVRESDNYCLSDQTKFFKKEIVDKGMVVGEKKSKCGSGECWNGTIIKLKDGTHYLTTPSYKFIGKASDDSIIIQDKEDSTFKMIPRWNKENIKKLPNNEEFLWKTEEEKAKEDTYYNPFDPRIFLAR